MWGVYSLLWDTVVYVYIKKCIKYTYVFIILFSLRYWYAFPFYSNVVKQKIINSIMKIIFEPLCFLAL